MRDQQLSRYIVMASCRADQDLSRTRAAVALTHRHLFFWCTGMCADKCAGLLLRACLLFTAWHHRTHLGLGLGSSTDAEVPNNHFFSFFVSHTAETVTAT